MLPGRLAVPLPYRRNMVIQTQLFGDAHSQTKAGDKAGERNPFLQITYGINQIQELFAGFLIQLR